MVECNANRKTVEEFYLEVFPSVARLVQKSGGHLEDAKDVFQDALVIYMEKLRSTTPPEIDNESAYVTGIAKHLFYVKKRKDLRFEKGDLLENHLVTDEESLRKNRLVALLEQSGEKCMKLLKRFYYDQRSMADISSEFGFSGERSAVVQKHKCLQKMRLKVKLLAIEKDDFYE